MGYFGSDAMKMDEHTRCLRNPFVAFLIAYTAANRDPAERRTHADGAWCELRGLPRSMA
jgi:hypothetical protein